MSAVSTVASDAASIDWNIVAGAIATFIVTGIITWLGLRKGKEKAADPSRSEVTSIVGASILETATIKEFSRSIILATDAIEEHTRELRENTRELRELKEEQRRCNDLTLMSRSSRR